MANYYHYGSGATHHHKEINITINGNVTTQSVSELVRILSEDAVDTDYEDVTHPPIVDELAPLFFGNWMEAERFLKMVDGARPTEVTQMVNDLLRKEKLLRSCCGTRLWSILHDNGLYNPSVQNWRRQVNT